MKAGIEYAAQRVAQKIHRLKDKKQKANDGCGLKIDEYFRKKENLPKGKEVN